MTDKQRALLWVMDLIDLALTEAASPLLALYDQRGSLVRQLDQVAATLRQKLAENERTYEQGLKISKQRAKDEPRSREPAARRAR